MKNVKKMMIQMTAAGNGASLNIAMKTAGTEQKILRILQMMSLLLTAGEMIPSLMTEVIAMYPMMTEVFLSFITKMSTMRKATEFITMKTKM